MLDTPDSSGTYNYFSHNHYYVRIFARRSLKRRANKNIIFRATSSYFYGNASHSRFHGLLRIPAQILCRRLARSSRTPRWKLGAVLWTFPCPTHHPVRCCFWISASLRRRGSLLCLGGAEILVASLATTGRFTTLEQTLPTSLRQPSTLLAAVVCSDIRRAFTRSLRFHICLPEKVTGIWYV